MSPTDYFNVVGLILNVIGAYLIFKNSPKNEGQLFLYQSSERPTRERNANNKNNKMRTGMLLILVGFIFQFSAFVISKF